jgi:hypothetical protein
MYRPQFPYPLPPAPCEADRCQYSFDTSNTPALAQVLGAGQQTGRIPLNMDVDADFYLRAITTLGTTSFPALSCSFRLVDPESNNLSDSDNAQQSTNFEIPMEYSDTHGAGLVVLESGQWLIGSGGAGGVFAHGGSSFLLYLFNPAAVPIDLSTFVINLHGIKVFSGVCAR